MAKYKTTVTEKDGSKSSGYIENGKSYYDNGREINAGASVVDSTGKTWTKGGATTNTSSNKSSSVNLSPNKSSGGNSVSIIDNMVKNAENSTGKSINDNATKTDSGWYLPKTNNSANVSRPSSQISYEEVEEYNPYEELEEYYRKAYQDLEAQIREQNRLAVEQGTNRLNAQKANINQAADENARQAYVQYMQSQKALPQQLASQGVTGGATETANLGLQTAYQNNVNSINTNKANRLQEIDNAIVDLQNTGDLAMVEQVLANNQLALDAYTAAFDKGTSYNQWATEFNANRQDVAVDQAYRDKVYADSIAQQEWEKNWLKTKYDDEKKQAEMDRVLQGYYNGNYSIGYTSAQTGIPEEYLYDTKSERELMAKLERANTQSLISNRNYQTQKIKQENAEKEQGKQYYNLATQINNQYVNNATGKNAGDAVIVDDGNGGYMINPNISRGSYLDLVIARAFDSNMSDNEVKTFLNNLGISDSEISRVAAYYLK